MIRQGLDRRFVGAVLIVLMLVAAVAVPGVLGRYMTGQEAPAVHVKPRPVPGICMAPLNDPDQLNSVIDLVPVVPCSEPHSAQIVSVGTLDSKTWKVRPTVADSAFTNGDLSNKCDSLAAKFLGWGNKSSAPRVQLRFFTRLTVPGDLEWFLGQRWYACELMPGVLDYPISYSGTAENASFRTPPGAFANCSDGPGLLAVSCDHPHHAEQLTRTYTRNGVTISADDCKTLVGKVIGTSDPTFGGQLAVLVRSDGGSSTCWVTTTSSRSLIATLINHGKGPLPLQ